MLHLPHIEFWSGVRPWIADHAFLYVRWHSAWIPCSSDFSKCNLLVSKKRSLQVYRQTYKLMRIVHMYTSWEPLWSPCMSLAHNLLNQRPKPCSSWHRCLYKSSGSCTNLIIQEIDKPSCIELDISKKALFKYRVKLTWSGMVTICFCYAGDSLKIGQSVLQPWCPLYISFSSGWPLSLQGSFPF
jgi:hypothetical protein